MEVTRQSFKELDGVIDDLHKTLDRWELDGAFTPDLEPDTIQLVKLAIHEWVANLVQHADFGDTKPEIILDIFPNVETDTSGRQVVHLGRKLKEIWEAKLRLDFPDYNIVVSFPEEARTGGGGN